MMNALKGGAHFFAYLCSFFTLITCVCFFLGGIVGCILLLFGAPSMYPLVPIAVTLAALLGGVMSGSVLLALMR